MKEGIISLDFGAKLGPYEIVAPLGAGGMGEVYRARDTRLDRSVAIKILPTHLSENPEARDRFDREARAISSLSHPNICHLYDVGTQDGTRLASSVCRDGVAIRRKKQRFPNIGNLRQTVIFYLPLLPDCAKLHR